MTKNIASVATHRVLPLVPERPEILAALVSACHGVIGHGVAWKSGACYITLRDFTVVAVPQHFKNRALKTLGARVLSVR